MLALALVLGLALGPLLGGAPPRDEATLALVGDVNFRGLERATGIFDAVRPLLDGADYAVANLEGLLLEDPVDAYRNARINITAHARFAALLPGSGFDAVSLANNHTWDHGAAGLLEHLGHLARHGVTSFGAGRDDEAARAALRIALPVGCVAIVPATLKSNKKTPLDAAAAGAFAATYPIDALDPLVARLAAERARGCFTIASVHAGRERAALPPTAVRAAFRTLAAAADLVVGHHPHVLEGVAPAGADGAPIVYSLGNFLFVNRDADKRRSGVLIVRLARGEARPHLVELALAPVTIDARSYLPRPATAAEAAETAKLLERRSRPLGGAARLEGGRIVFTLGPSAAAEP